MWRTRNVIRDSTVADPLEQVEPQEKKKTPKGRAKKRLTYTRRFVNVTMTGGKRKVSGTAFLVAPRRNADPLQMNPNPGS